MMTVNELAIVARRLWPRVQAHARKELTNHSSDDAIVLATEVWEAVLQSVAKTKHRVNGKGRPILSLEAYLFGAFHHRFNRALRKERRRLEMIKHLSLSRDLEWLREAHDSRAVADMDRSIQVKQTIESMDDWTRRVWMARQAGYSWKEIAKYLRLTEPQAKLRFRYAISQLCADSAMGREVGARAGSPSTRLAVNLAVRFKAGLARGEFDRTRLFPRRREANPLMEGTTIWRTTAYQQMIDRDFAPCTIRYTHAIGWGASPCVWSPGAGFRSRNCAPRERSARIRRTHTHDNGKGNLRMDDVRVTGYELICFQVIGLAGCFSCGKWVLAAHIQQRSYDSFRRCICGLRSIAAQAPVFVVCIAQRGRDLPRDSRSNRIGNSHRLVIAGMGYEYRPPHLLLRHHLPKSSIVLSVEFRSEGIMGECSFK